MLERDPLLSSLEFSSLRTTAEQLRSEVNVVWGSLSVPSSTTVFWALEPDVSDVVELFFDQRFDQVDVSSKAVQFAFPLNYMTPEGTCYYVASYLSHCLQFAGYLVADAPFIHVVSTFAPKRAKKLYCGLSIAQHTAISEYLNLALAHPRIFYAVDQLEFLERCARSWQRR